jgi:aerobic-type carbon monoxide dehydrogenase small subunit (CoxS/CutS family)
MAMTVVYSEKYKHQLAEMASVLPLAPDKAAELLNYAYQLGYCQGAIVNVTKILSHIPEKAQEKVDPLAWSKAAGVEEF